MATKKQVLTALKNKHPDAILDVNHDDGGEFQAALTAPVGHHWEHLVHSVQLPFWYSGKRSDYWDMALEEIKELPNAVACSEIKCPLAEHRGECDYWSEC